MTPEHLRQALAQIDRPGSFCVRGSVSSGIPGLTIPEIGAVKLPLSVARAKQIKKLCEQAPYGKGEETVVDTKVRRVWRLLPNRFELTHPEWNEFLERTLTTVRDELGLQDEKLECSLYNLLLYEKGSFFLPHRDGEKADRMVATLVIVLPSAYEGGELIIRHDGKEETIDFTTVENGEFMLHFAAFYADCEHEIRPLKSGYRLCLVYNVTLTKSEKRITAPRVSSHVESVANILQLNAILDAKLTARFVLHIQDLPERYPMQPVQIDALIALCDVLTEPLPELVLWLTKCRESLEEMTAEEPSEPIDFARVAPLVCECQHCRSVNEFLVDRMRSVHRIRASQKEREHTELRVKYRQCDLTCTAERRGSPHTLVLTKTTASFERRLKKYREDLEQLEIVKAIQAQTCTISNEGESE